jgi:methylaspartate ammonia-lyase
VRDYGSIEGGSRRDGGAAIFPHYVEQRHLAAVPLQQAKVVLSQDRVSQGAEIGVQYSNARARDKLLFHDGRDPLSMIADSPRSRAEIRTGEATPIFHPGWAGAK